MFRYFNSIMDIKKNRAFFESIHSLLPKKKKNLTSLIKPKIEVIEEKTIEPKVRSQSQGEDELNEEPPKVDIRENVSFEGKKPTESILLPEHIVPALNAKDHKDLFRSYFCRHFDIILKINKSEALNLEKQIIDPLVLELGSYVNLEAVQQSWSTGKVYTTKDKVLLNLLKIGRYLKNGIVFLVTVLAVSVQRFFMNQFVIIFIETVLAITYVVYSTPSFVIYPIILWIFTNVYPKFDSILGLNLKIWLLMVPTGLNCLIAKRRSNTDMTVSTNKDFNFNAKTDYNVIDISTLGVILMSFVILEMIIMASRKASQPTASNLEGDHSTHKVSKSFLLISSMLYNNSIYLIMINIYVIALDINIISLGLIVYFIRLILVRQIGPKTYYTLFWYNQVSIFFRYIYNHLKPAQESTKHVRNYELWRLIGVEESDTMSTQTKLLLNFSLQMLLILVIFNIRNKEVFEKMTEHEDENNVKMAFTSPHGLKAILKNLYDFLKYAAFHCLPWLAYIVVYLAMVFTSTSLITLLELFYLCYLFITHMRLNIEQRFAGLHLMRSSWKGLVTFCAIMALSRYILWFIAQDYLKNNFDFINTMKTFIEEKLGFIGLLPKDLSAAYLELLPSFLAMYLGSLVLHRINMVEFTLKNREEIESINIEEADSVPVVRVMREDEDLEDHITSVKHSMVEENPHDIDGGKKGASSFMKPRASVAFIQQDIRVQLTKKERDEYKSKKLKLKARRDVLGDINLLQ
jgi:hypothetical protein